MLLAATGALQLVFLIPLFFFLKGHQHFLKVLLYLELFILGLVIFFACIPMKKILFSSMFFWLLGLVKQELV